MMRSSRRLLHQLLARKTSQRTPAMVDPHRMLGSPSQLDARSPSQGWLRTTLLVALGVTAGLIGPGMARAALPAPTGVEQVGTTTFAFHDTATHRALMVSLWYPGTREAVRHPRARYVSPRLRRVLIQSGLGDIRSLSMRTNAREGARPRPGLLPVALFSPGFGGPRVLYQVLPEDLASHGWLVVSVDHTGEVPIEFPHGKIVAARAGLNPFTDASVRTRRVGDLRFILHHLRGRTNSVSAVLRRFARGGAPARPDLQHVGAVGHSLGGASAASTMLEEPAIRAGVNMDGLMFDNVIKRGLGRPFMLLDAENHFAGDGSQSEFFGNLRGPRLAIEVAGTQHLSFTDAPVAAPGFPGTGTIPGPRAVTIERAYVRAFLDTYARGRSSSLVRRPSSRFPEVRFVPGGRSVSSR
jgi:predicted dienelactone hydrolase